jgi:hypothetical protein
MCQLHSVTTDYRVWLTISDVDNLTMDHPWSSYSSNIATYLMVHLWVSLIIVSTYPKMNREADHPSPFGTRVNFMWSYISTPLCTILRVQEQRSLYLTVKFQHSHKLLRNELRGMVVGAMGLWPSFGSIPIVSNVAVFSCYCNERRLCRDNWKPILLVTKTISRQSGKKIQIFCTAFSCLSRILQLVVRAAWGVERLAFLYWP